METVNDTTPPADPPPYRQPGHRLTRSTDDKVVGGLAGGLGRWFGIDPVVLRIAFVVLTLAGGSGILLYLVGWLMIPDDAGAGALNRFGNERNSKLAAAVLAGLAVLILVDNIAGGDDDIPLGVVLVGLGGLYLWSRRSSADGGPPAPPSPPAPPAPSGPAIIDTDLSAAPTVALESGADPPAPPPARPEPKTRSAIVAVTLSLLAVLAGGLTLVGVSLSTGLALALVLIGAALVVGAWRGRARWLIPLGLVLSMALAAASVIDVPVKGGSGDVVFRPVALEDLRSPYRMAAGEMVLDLGGLDLRGETVTVVASIAAGELAVVVPPGVALEIDARAGLGELIILGRQSEGIDIRRELDELGREGAGRLVLRTHAGVGVVEVRRAPA
ncbi:MAG: PspC domain-containing protein [Acidimicrobiales bacterium]